MKTSTYKTAAKSALNGKWGIAIGVFFLYFIISSILGAPENEWIFYAVNVSNQWTALYWVPMVPS